MGFDRPLAERGKRRPGVEETEGNEIGGPSLGRFEDLIPPQVLLDRPVRVIVGPEDQGQVCDVLGAHLRLLVDQCVGVIGLTIRIAIDHFGDFIELSDLARRGETKDFFVKNLEALGVNEFAGG